MVPEKGLEPSQLMLQESRSCMSTHSTIPANIEYVIYLFSLVLATLRLAADRLLLILLRLSSYSIPLLFSDFRHHHSLAHFKLSIVVSEL